MKTKVLAQTLRAFAELADFNSSDELFRLAAIFEAGKNETLLARLKQMSPSTSYPVTLKNSVEIIRAGFVAAGAKKQAAALGELLKYFSGKEGGSLDRFLSEISTAPQRTVLVPSTSTKADHSLAQSILHDLDDCSLDDVAFQRIIQKLSSRRTVSTPTLALIAHLFLRSGHPFRDRKTAIAAILKRREANKKKRTAEAGYADLCLMEP